MSVPDAEDLLWSFQIDGERRIWDWDDGAPHPWVLQPVREPKAGSYSGHVPVDAWSLTTGGRVRVESGLEFGLFRELDRDRTVTWIVAQPLALTVPGPSAKPRDLIPDFLTLHADGSLKVWNVRPTERMGAKFRAASALIGEACSHRGIGYEVFSGFGVTRRVNLGWIDAYRDPPAGLERFRPQIETFVGDGCRFGDLLTFAGHYGIPSVWHMVWGGALHIDLDARIVESSVVTR